MSDIKPPKLPGHLSSDDQLVLESMIEFTTNDFITWRDDNKGNFESSVDPYHVVLTILRTDSVSLTFTDRDDRVQISAQGDDILGGAGRGGELATKLSKAVNDAIEREKQRKHGRLVEAIKKLRDRK